MGRALAHHSRPQHQIPPCHEVPRGAAAAARCRGVAQQTPRLLDESAVDVAPDWLLEDEEDEEEDLMSFVHLDERDDEDEDPDDDVDEWAAGAGKASWTASRTMDWAWVRILLPVWDAKPRTMT